MSQGRAHWIATLKSWAITLIFSGIGVVAGLFCALAILFPLGQTLIDSDDDDVVLATILYFRWAADAFGLACGAAGAAIGGIVGRTLAQNDSSVTAALPIENARNQTGA